MKLFICQKIFFCAPFHKELIETGFYFLETVSIITDNENDKIVFVHILEQATVLKVVLDDYVRDRVKHELNVGRVSGTCEVCVDLLEVAFSVSTPMPVQGLKLQLDICRGILVCVGS